MINIILIGLLFLVLGFILLMALIILGIIFYNPFRYPYFVVNIDVSGKKNISMIEEIELYIIKNGIVYFESHHTKTEIWKKDNYDKANRSILKFIRVKQYNKSIDDSHEFVFNLVRKQKRYRQRNYVRESYTISNKVEHFSCDYNFILKRYQALKSINFETTTNKYNAKNQRNLMTKELRRKIMIRDNYTCQICGKYMPDGVGLQIDHIIPVSKGGKTVESNLRVLCSKCNGRKSNK